MYTGYRLFLRWGGVLGFARSLVGASARLTLVVCVINPGSDAVFHVSWGPNQWVGRAGWATATGVRGTRGGETRAPREGAIGDLGERGLLKRRGRRGAPL